MYAINLRCDECAHTFSMDKPINTCPDCGGLLDVQYDLEAIRRAFDPEAIYRRPPTVWRWKEFLPVADERHIVTLGEGATPLHRCPRLAEALGVRECWVKDETQGPTGSLKDRTFSVAVSKAVELGVRRVVTFTSGNAGAALAAYSAKAGLQALILVNEWATNEKLAMMQVYGHPVVKLRWNSFSDVTGMMEAAIRDLGLYQFVNFLNPFRHEGGKTYAYEISLDLGWQVPDRVIQPIGTGGGIYGTWKGYRELQSLGLVGRIPKMTGVQPEAAAPVCVAFQRGERKAGRHGDPSKTIAQSIAGDSVIQGGKRVLDAMYETGGYGETVSDDEIREGMVLLGQEGVFGEPAGGAVVAAARKLVRKGVIVPDERIVLVVTGSGLKQPHALEGHFPDPEVMQASPENLADLLRKTWGG
jgi:threonine synthase